MHRVRNLGGGNMSTMTPSLRATGAAILVAAALAGIAAPAHARCAEPSTPKEALEINDVAFVGQVLETVGGGRVAVVEVQSIWKGGDIIGVTRVEGGEPDSPSRDDRTFETGQQYLFFPRNEDPPFRDDGCTATTELTDEVGRLEPEDARAPRSGRSNSLLALLVVAIVAAGVYQARRALGSSPGGRRRQSKESLRFPSGRH
jgi:hypothetical protein